MTGVTRRLRDAGPADRDALLREILGSTCTAFDRGEHVWTVRLSHGRDVVVECEWRVRRGERVVLARRDDGQWFGLGRALEAVAEARTLLVDRRVVAARIGASGDLVLDFDGGHSFETFTDSSGYESWSLGRDGVTVAVCVGGGDLRRIEPG